MSHFLHIYYAPTTLFLVAIGFLLLVCMYFSYELSRLEERTRVLAEELAILRAEQEATGDEHADDQLTPYDRVAGRLRSERSSVRQRRRGAARRAGRRGRTCGGG